MITKNDKQFNKFDISVIIPSYNTEQYIENCLDSVLQQKSSDKCEIIIIDDASADNSIQKVVGFQNRNKKYKNITVLKNANNVGVSAARNRGLSMASGRYVVLLDSDDVLGYKPSLACQNFDPYYLESLKYTLDSNSNISMAVGNILPMDESGANPNYSDRFCKWFYESNRELKSHSAAIEFLDKRINANSIMYRNELIKKSNLHFITGMFYFEDANFTTKYALSAMDHYDYILKIIPDAFYGYRCRPDSAMRKLANHSEKNIRGLKFMQDEIFHNSKLLLECGYKFGYASEIFNNFARKFSNNGKKVERYVVKKSQEMYSGMFELVPKKCIRCVMTDCSNCSNKSDLLKVAKLAQERLNPVR